MIGRLLLCVALSGFWTISNAKAQGAARTWSCEGSLIAPTSQNPAVMKLQLAIGPGRNLSLSGLDGNPSIKFASDNSIQLRFVSKDFTGEFFHYTGDLFLVYRSKHLARLACK
jgi:hypothetical protein